MASHLTVFLTFLFLFLFFTMSVIMHTHRDFIVLYMLISFGFEKLFNNDQFIDKNVFEFYSLFS